MGSGVARQCSGNGCLARWTVRSPIAPAEAQQVEELEERPGHGPDPRFVCSTGDLLDCSTTIHA
jgi:hypothetical protein